MKEEYFVMFQQFGKNGRWIKKTFTIYHQWILPYRKGITANLCSELEFKCQEHEIYHGRKMVNN